MEDLIHFQCPEVVNETLDTLGTVIHAYEEQHYPMPECRGGDSLRFLMDEHCLTQGDLSDVGSQGVISELIHGKRELK